MRREENQQFRLLVLLNVPFERVTQQRDITEDRHLVFLINHLSGNQTADHDGLVAGGHDDGVGGALVDHRRIDARRDRDRGRAERRDFRRDDHLDQAGLRDERRHT